MLRLIFLTFLMINVKAAYAQLPSFADLPPLHFISDRQVYQWTPDGVVAPIGDLLPESLMAFHPAPMDDALLLEVRVEQVSPALVQTSELILLNLTNGEQTRIASPSSERSTPIWSLDGMRIAWTEGTDIRRLIIYDRTDGLASTTSTDLPAPSFAPQPTPLLGWVHDGIIVKDVTLDHDLRVATTIGFRLYAEDGIFRSYPHPFTRDTERDKERARYIVLNEISTLFIDGDRYIALLEFPYGGIYTQGGEIVRVARSSNSIRVHPPIYRADPLSAHLSAIRDDNTAYTPITSSGGISFSMEGASVLVSPDGSAVVQDRRSRELMGWHKEIGEFTISLPFEPETLFWGEPRLQINVGAARLTANGRCESGLNYEIQTYPDQLAFINGDESRPLYDTPYFDSSIAMDVPVGTTVRVSDGFLCGLATIGMVGGVRVGAWREVQVGDRIGWMPEAMWDRYWLVPTCPPEGCGAVE